MNIPLTWKSLANEKSHSPLFRQTNTMCPHPCVRNKDSVRFVGASSSCACCVASFCSVVLSVGLEPVTSHMCLLVCIVRSRSLFVCLPRHDRRRSRTTEPPDNKSVWRVNDLCQLKWKICANANKYYRYSTSAVESSWHFFNAKLHDLCFELRTHPPFKAYFAPDFHLFGHRTEIWGDRNKGCIQMFALRFNDCIAHEGGNLDE